MTDKFRTIAAERMTPGEADDIAAAVMDTCAGAGRIDRALHENLLYSLRAGWLVRPVVMVLLALAVLALPRPLFSEMRNERSGILVLRGRPSFRREDLVFRSLGWPIGAGIGPKVVGTSMILFGTVSFVCVVFGRSPTCPRHRVLARRR